MTTPYGYGRTRRPKAIWNDAVVATKQAATTVTVVAAGDLAANLDSTDAGENGYSTENQRYLHIQIENDADDDTLKLYTYNYAFGAWGEYYIPVAGNGSTAEATYVEAKWTSLNGKKFLIVPIDGIDRIAFVHDGTLNDMVVRAACTSF